jgi:multidrug efflux pump
VRLSAICIERPVFTVVMSLAIILFGAISLPLLPNRELPDIDAPIVSITTVYPGAAAEVVETSVTLPLEEVKIEPIGLRAVYDRCHTEVQ